MTAAIAVVAAALVSAGASQDTLRLPALQAAAVTHDARQRQQALHERTHVLRLRDLRGEWLPQLSLRGETTQQSDVMRLPIRLPDVEPPESPRARYQVALDAEQLVYDGAVLRRRAAVERSRHDAAQAELEVTLYDLRSEVDEAFFRALLLQLRDAELRLLAADLDARLGELRARVRAGAALPGDTAAVEAERLRVVQALDEVAAGRAATLAVLGELTALPIGEGDVLVLPEQAAAVERVEAAGGAAAARVRPEFRHLAQLRQRLEHEAAVVAARARPQLRAFAQVGVGRPGPIELFDDDVNEFWFVGLRLRWQPWTWGATGREREQLRLQRQVLDTEEAALAARLARQVEPELHAMRQLEAALLTDERVVALREQVERQARRQLEERAITPSQYVTVRNELFEARLEQQRRRVELERARTRYLTALGIVAEEG